jgi:hypothetical protein
VDAELIARMIAHEHTKLHAWIPPTPQQREIDRLIKRRAMLVSLREAVTMSLRELDGFAGELKALRTRFNQLIARIDLRVKALTRPAAFDEIYRRLKQGKIVLIVGRIFAVDLYPLPRACQTSGLKRNYVVPGKLQFRRGGDRQAQSYPIATDASKHLVGGEVRVEAIDRSRADTGERKKQSVKMCLAAGFGSVDRQGASALIFIY